MQETLASLGAGIAYSRLLRLRTGPEEKLPQPSLLLECDLCESWEIVDPLTYRFQLRRGVHWQDIPPVGGRELVAQDVVYSYGRQRTPGWANAELLRSIHTVETEGLHTLKITLKPGFADADFLLSLADGHTKVVAKEAVDDVVGDLEDGPVIGTGPWKWIPERSVEDLETVFEKNLNYFENGLPFADELIIKVIRDESTRLANFAAGEVDVYRISPKSWDQLIGVPGAKFERFLSRQGGTGLILTMNVSRPPFDNHRVRQAVLRALGPWEYVRTTWAGQGFVSLGIPVQSPDWLLTRDEMRGDYFADPEISANLLSGTGLPMPLGFDFTVADYGDIYLRQGRRIEEDLRSVGFDPVLKVLNPSQYNDRVWRDKEYQLAVGQLPPTSTTNSFLFAILHSSGRGNVLAHSDSRLDEMIEEQALEGDRAERGNLVRALQRYLLEKAYYFSPVTEGTRWVYATHIKGFYPNTAASEYIYWAKAWVE